MSNKADSDIINSLESEIKRISLENSILRENEEKVYSMLENSSEAFQSLDVDGNILTVNKKWCEELSYKKEEVIGRAFDSFLAPESKPKYVENFPKFKKNGHTSAVEFEMLKKNGEKISVSYNGVILYSDIGQMLQTNCVFTNITQQKNLQKKLLETNKQLINITKNIPGTIYTFQLFPDGRSSFPYVSDTMYDVLGLTAEAIKEDNANIFDLFSQEDLKHVNQTIKVSFHKLTICEGKYRVMHPKKGVIWIEWKARPEKQLDGSVVWYGYIHDITKNKISEEELKKSQSIAKIGSWLLDISSNKLHWSDETYRIFNVDKEVSLNFEMFLALVHPEDRHSLQQAWENALNGEVYDIEHRIIVNNQIKWLNEKVNFEFDKEGKLSRAIGIAQDITDRKEMAKALADENTRLEITEKIAHLGSWEQNISDDTLQWSDEVYRIFEIDTSIKMNFDNFIERVHPEDRESISQAFQASVQERKPYHLDHRLLLPDGRIKYISEHANHFYDSNDNHIHTIGTLQDVTEQKNIEIELQMNEEKFKSLMQQSPSVIEIYDMDGLQIEVNHAYEILWGFPASHTLNKFNLFNSEEMKSTGLLTHVKKAYSGEVVNVPTYQFNTTGKTEADGLGRTRWLNTIMYPLKEEEGKVVNLVITHEDITEQVSAQEDAKKRDEMLTSVFQVIPDLLFIMASDGTIIDYRAQNDNELYVPPEVFLGKNMQNALPQDIGSIFDEKIKSIAQDNQPKTFEYELDVEGTTNYFEARMAKLPVDDHIMTIVRNITEQVLSQQQLKFQAKLLEQATSAIDVVDENGHFSYLNNSYVQMWGYETKKEILGTSPINHCLDPDMPKHIIETIEKDKEHTFEFKALKKDGTTFDALMTVTCIDFKNEKFYIGSTLDVSELKKKDEMIIAQSRLAAMGEMIGMIAHQWRQPLTVISMDVNNMLLDIRLDDLDINNVKEYSNDILTQTQHLSETIDDFRNFFKPDKSASKVKMQEILESTYIIVKDSLTNNNIRLETSYESESEVEAFKRELMQVFVNIITNAKDSLMQQKTEDACIGIRVFEDEESVITEICDNGMGIDELILSKVFDPYFSTKDEKTGTGLGLYMSKMIVEDHLHGKIEAFNQDIGACFRVKLYKPKEV